MEKSGYISWQEAGFVPSSGSTVTVYLNPVASPSPSPSPTPSPQVGTFNIGDYAVPIVVVTAAAAIGYVLLT